MTHKPLQAYIEQAGILFAISAKLFTIHIPLQIQSWSQIAAHKQHSKRFDVWGYVLNSPSLAVARVTYSIKKPSHASSYYRQCSINYLNTSLNFFF